MTDIVFSQESIISLVVMAVLGIAVPVAAALVWRFGANKGTLKATFIGAGMFFLFAMVLERLLHMLVIPLVIYEPVMYVIYGALAAGIFEETARCLSFRFLMKKSRSAENAVSYGLGHGGCEMLLLMGLTAVNALALIAVVNSADSGLAGIPSDISDAIDYNLIISQLSGYAKLTMSGALVGIFERIVAMVLHVSLSVLVMESVMIKGRAWLYPAAIIIHALMDVPAVLYQCGAIPITVCEVIMTVFTAVWAVVAYKRYKFLKAQ